MKEDLTELVKTISARRNALLQEYSEYDLHQLRVAVRRVRTLLRFESHPEAWQLRREWGFLVSHTNPARDWDTLAERLDDLPEEEQPVGLVAAVNRQRDKVWKDVLRTLRNPQWEDTHTRMQAYLDRGVDPEHEPVDGEDIIRDASNRVNQAWERAQERGDNRAWHKLRIAIKDLRYSLDTLSQSSVDEPIELCKQLQDKLGIWHDSIIHRELLQVVDRELAPDEKSAKDAAAELDTDLFAEGVKCLKEARHTMAARAQLLERKR